MITEQWFSEYIDRFIEAINARDWDMLDKLVDLYIADEYIGHLPGAIDPVRGREGQKEWFRNVIGSLPGYKTSVEDIFATRDKGAVRGKGRWTDPTTGKAQTVSSILIFHFKDEKVLEEWELVGEWEDAA